MHPSKNKVNVLMVFPDGGGWVESMAHPDEIVDVHEAVSLLASGESAVIRQEDYYALYRELKKYRDSGR